MGNKNKSKNPVPYDTGLFAFALIQSGDVLLSHGETPHYHRRIGVSLLSSVWGQVGPPLYRRQDYSFNNFSLLCSAISSVSQPNKLITFKTFFFSEFRLCIITTPKTLERCIVKPLGQLVCVSSMYHYTYTPHLSTS